MKTKLLFASLILLLTINLGAQQFSQQPLPIANGDYYRLALLDEEPQYKVKGNNIDSLVITNYNTSSKGEKLEDTKKTVICIINRGDTLLYRNDVDNGNTYLYQTDDGQHLSREIKNNEIIAFEDSIALNQRFYKRISDGVVMDSIVTVYYKDSLVREAYHPGDIDPALYKYKTTTMKYDSNDKIIEIDNKLFFGAMRVLVDYDSNGIIKSMTQKYLILGKDEENEQIVQIKTEINNRGDWVKMVMCKNDECFSMIEREIFYKD